MKRLSRDAMRCLGRPVLVSIVMLFLGSTRAAGDIDPPGCNGNGVQLSISRTPGAGVNGQAINYKFSIANLNDPTTVACDATGVTVNFYCPGPDGTPNFSNPINLATGVNLPAGTLATALPPQTCTLNVNPGVTVATASIVAGQQMGNPNHACTTSNPCPQGTLHDSATDDAFQSNKTVSVGVLTCSVQVDKEVKCGAGPFVDVGFVSNNEDGTASCLGWNAFTIDGTNMAAEALTVQYTAKNTGDARLFSCTVTESNTALSSTAVTIGDVAAGGTSAPVPINTACSDALNGVEPDTATLSCFCTADKNPSLVATATDTASFQCQTPGLTVTKVCAEGDVNGNNAITITVENTGTADLENCTVTDTNFTDAGCPASGDPTGTSAPVAVSPSTIANLAHGSTATATGTAAGLTNDSCNTAAVTCEIKGSVDPNNPGHQKTLTGKAKDTCEVPICELAVEKTACVAAVAPPGPGCTGGAIALTLKYTGASISGPTTVTVTGSSRASVTYSLASLNNGDILTLASENDFTIDP